MSDYSQIHVYHVEENECVDTREQQATERMDKRKETELTEDREHELRLAKLNALVSLASSLGSSDIDIVKLFLAFLREL